MTKKRPAFFLGCMLIMRACCNAIAGPEEDGGYWFNLRMQGGFPAPDVYWDFDINPRLRNEGKHIDTLYVRPAVFYKTDPNNSLWLGRDKIIGHPDGKAAYHESRWWQQYQHQFDSFHSFTLTNRTRLEERRREGFHDTGHRLRQMLKVSTPVSRHPALSVVLSDEVFINVDHTDWGAFRGLDQNRLFIGLNWKINKGAMLETGYLNQFTHKTTQNLENHVISTTLGFKF